MIENIVSSFLQASTTSSPSSLPQELQKIAAEFGWKDLIIYLCDYDQDFLHPLETDPSLPVLASLPIEGTMAGSCFREQQIFQTTIAPESIQFWVPITERANRLGVLELTLENPNDQTEQSLLQIGFLLAHFIIASSNYTDAYMMTKRRRTLNLTAEIHWDMLLPVASFTNSVLSLSGIIEPAYDVAGDCYDYSQNGNILNVALFDVMGRGMKATFLSSLTIASYRHNRRQGLSLEQIAESLDGAICSRGEEGSSVKGLLCKFDLDHQKLEWLSAGQEAPILFRDGNISKLKGETNELLGLDIDDFISNTIYIQSGDIVILFSDGVINASSREGEQFGDKRFDELVQQAINSCNNTSEMTRVIAHKIKQYVDGDLKDDMGIVIIRWK